MFKKQDIVQFSVAIAFSVIALILCLTVLPPEIQLMEGGKVKSNLFLVLLTALPMAVTLLVAVSEKDRMLSWITLFAVEAFACVKAIGLITAFSFNTDILFHGLFLVLEAAFAVHLWLIKKTDAKCAFRWQWIKTDEGFFKAQRAGARVITLLAVAEGVNMLLSSFSLYSFTLSAGISIVLCYVAFLLILRKVKHLD